MALADITSQIAGAYSGFLSVLPPFFQTFFNLFFLSLLVFLYAVFIWVFHRFVSKKNILNLDLNKYNNSDHPFVVKMVATLFYILEYIIILPILIFFWFSMFGIFLIVLTDIDVPSILTISAIVIAAIRITSYTNESAARELAKLLPLTMLATFILSPNFFDFERVINNTSQIPGVFHTILSYLLFIIVLELILRFFEFVFTLLDVMQKKPG